MIKFGARIAYILYYNIYIIRGSARSGASKKGGVGKFIDFPALSVNIWKTVADTAKVTNRLIGSRTWAID